MMEPYELRFVPKSKLMKEKSYILGSAYKSAVHVAEPGKKALLRF